MDIRILTVEQMLVSFFVIKIARVLLDFINSQCAWVDFLGSHAVWIEVTIKLTMLLAVCTFNPDTLKIRASGDDIPLVVRLLFMWLWRSEEVFGVKRFWEQERNFVPSL